MPPFTVTVQDATGLDAGAAEQMVLECRERMGHEVLSAKEWPLFRVAATRLTGCGLYFLVRNCSLMFSPFSERYAPSSSTVIPSTPAAPLFLTICRYAALRLSLLTICSMRLLVSMRCFLSAPFAFAAFEVIDRRLLRLRSGTYFN